MVTAQEEWDQSQRTVFLVSGEAETDVGSTGANAAYSLRDGDGQHCWCEVGTIGYELSRATMTVGLLSRYNSTQIRHVRSSLPVQQVHLLDLDWQLLSEHRVVELIATAFPHGSAPALIEILDLSFHAKSVVVGQS